MARTVLYGSAMLASLDTTCRVALVLAVLMMVGICLLPWVTL